MWHLAYYYNLWVSCVYLCVLKFQALWLVDVVHAGYISRAPIGQNKGALRSPAGLCVYKSTEAEINSSIPALRKVCALTDSNKSDIQVG